MADIFISYARSDRDQVERLAACLEGSGADVWWDRRLVGGDEFAALIERELEAAQAVIVAWSAAGVKSHWVRDEASFAARAGKLIAISLDGTPPPMGFGQFHSIDFCHPDDEDGDEALAQLLRSIAARQGQTPEHAASRPARKAPGPARKRPADDMPWIAMLPIKVRGSDPDLPNLAEDLTQNIASGLARFSYLKVGMERSGAEGRRAGASYVLDCTLRQAGARLRLAVRLSHSDGDRQVWGENYNRDYDPETIFDVQDDLTDHLVASVADPFGALMHDLTAPVLELEPEAMTPYQALLRYFVYRQRVTAEDHAIALEAIEVARERQPLNSDLWAAKALLELDSYKNRFNVTRDSAQPSLKSARQALALNPQSAFAHYALFECAFHAGDFQAASTAAAQRCLALNPCDTDAAAMIGIYLMFLGDWDEGRAVSQRALELHANGPGWYRYGLVCYAMRHGRFEEALGELGRANMPQYHVHQALLTQTYSGLGRFEDAHTAWQDFLDVWPEDMAGYRDHLQRWHVNEPDFHNQLLSLYKDAGISLEDGSVRRANDDKRTTSSAAGPSPGNALELTAQAQASLPGRDDFVGREAERAALRQMLAEARAGRGGLVLIGGEPGVGKSRLVEEIQAMGQAEGMLPLTGHSYEERSMPFVSTIETLESLDRMLEPAAFRELLGENVAELLRIMPGWRGRFADVGEPADVPPEQQRRAVFNALADVLRRLAAQQPLVMMLDDLHWADESSMELLEHVVPLLEQLPILMLATYRDAEADMGEPFRLGLPKLIRRKEVRRLPLGQISEADVGELLQRWTGNSPPDELSEAIYEGTEGNVFFVREVFTFLKESGQLLDEDGSWNLDLDISAIDVPQGVRLVIGQRLERLGEATVDVLLVAAAFGLRFHLQDVEVTAKVRGRAGETVLDELEAAEQAQLISTMGDAREPRYEFVHALVRQTLLESLSPARLQRLHAQIAETLDAHYGASAAERPAVFAHHYFAAGASADASRARHFMSLAGKQAEDASAWDEAWVWFNNSLNESRDLGSKERGELLYRRGTASRALHRWDDAMTDWHAALELLENTGSSAIVTDICVSLGHAFMWTGDYPSATQVAERGLLELGDDISAGRCRLLAVSAHCCSLAGDFERSNALLSEAIPAAEALGDPLLLGAYVLLPALFRDEHSMHISDQVLTGKKAIALVREHGNDYQLSAVLGTILTGLHFSGKYAEAKQIAEEVIALAEKEGDLGALMQGLAVTGLVASTMGDHDLAVETLAESIEVCTTGGFPWVSVIYGMLGLTQMIAGKFEDALHSADLAAEHSNPRGAHRGGDLAMAMCIKTLLGMPDAKAMLGLDLVPATAGQDNGIGNYNWSVALVVCGSLHGREDLAAAQLPAIEQLIGLGALDCWAIAGTSRIAAIAACCAGDAQGCHRYFSDALEFAERSPNYPEQLSTRLWYSWALIKLGEDSPKVRLLQDEANEIAKRFAMQAWCAQLSEVLNLAGPEGVNT